MTAQSLAWLSPCGQPQELRGGEVVKSSIFLTPARALNFLRGYQRQMCHEFTINSILNASHGGHGPCECAGPAAGRFGRPSRTMRIEGGEARAATGSAGRVEEGEAPWSAWRKRRD